MWAIVSIDFFLPGLSLRRLSSKLGGTPTNQ